MVSLGLCCYEKPLSSCSVRGLLFLAAHQHLILVAFLAIQPVMVSLLEESLASINTWFFSLFFGYTYKAQFIFIEYLVIFCLTSNSASWKSFDSLHFSFALIWRGWFFFFVKFLYSMFCNKATFFFFFPSWGHIVFSRGLPCCSAIIGLRVSNNIN